MPAPDPNSSITAAVAHATSRRVPSFPSRQYPYRKSGGHPGMAAAVPDQFRPEPGHVYRFFLGRDLAPVELSTEQVREQVHDSFAKFFLHRERRVKTLRELIDGLDSENGNPDGLPQQQIFLVADGGQIPWTPATAGLARQMRFVFVRHRGNDAELLISTAAPFDSEEVFLQVLAWDKINLAYQFYERRRGAWFWAGSSWEALEPDTRGHGPFDSHVNGGLVMKELKVPWQNWHSMSAIIKPDSMAPEDPLREDGFFKKLESADQLEQMVRGGLHRWTEGRFQRRLVNGKLTRAHEFFRQVLETTSVNLATAREVSATMGPDDALRIPRTFFLNSDALFGELGLHPSFPVPQASARDYLDCLARYEVAIGEGVVRLPGDTHFAFLVPEAAFEDLIVLRGLIQRGILPQKLAAALLMVDFPNPVFSARRAQLLSYVPDEFEGSDGSGSFTKHFVTAVEEAAASLGEDSPEQEFLRLWAASEADWQSHYTKLLQDYLDQVALKLRTADGFNDFFRLAESRRREFRKRPLAEFSLTTPSTNIPADAPLLEMARNATVRPKTIA